VAIVNRIAVRSSPSMDHLVDGGCADGLDLRGAMIADDAGDGAGDRRHAGIGGDSDELHGCLLAVMWRWWAEGRP